uniref:Tetraspanin-5-like n=1 Tax=Neolamprologus brichardi TaxID=32507 RepID=A0A3Q4MJ99_NEOBR
TEQKQHIGNRERISCCIKYFIFGFNILFWLLGMALVGIGLWAWSEKGVLSNISSITDLGGLDPVWLFMVVGGVMFILGFAGCIGALRENTFLLKFVSDQLTAKPRIVSRFQEDVINTQCGYDIRDSEQKDYINVKGCVPQFEKWLQDNLTLVAGIFIGVALLQIFGICLAQNLVSDIEAVRASW